MADSSRDDPVSEQKAINYWEIWIEPMVVTDIDAVKVIEDVSFEHPWSHTAFERELTHNKFAWYFVARQAGAVLGYGGMWIILDEGHITTLAVAPACRGRGLGRDILMHMIDFAHSRGVNRMTLEVRTGNKAAKSLYSSVGFTEVGVRKRYYITEDALVMWLELGGES